MTDAIVFKRKVSKPSQRSRERSPDAATEAGCVTPQTSEDVSPMMLTAKLKKGKRTKTKLDLSFTGEDEAENQEAFQVKKSNLSKKVALGLHPALKGLQPFVNPPTANGGPVYDSAYLSELKASTPSSRPRSAAGQSSNVDVSVSMDELAIQNSELPGETDVRGSGMLLDSTIKSAKEKRKHLRGIGASSSDDFISLTVAKKGEGSQGPHPESRLMREEDDMGDGDDEFAEYTSAQERIALGKKSKKLEAEKRKEAMVEMIIDAEEEDEDSKEWAEEQERRGGHRSEAASFAPVKETYKPAPIPRSTPVPTLGPAIARLTQELAALTTSHASNSHSMTSVAEEHARADARELELRQMISKAEEKRSWFATFREWLEGVATFLDEKFPVLEKLENEHLLILKERSDMIAQRRKADDEDDLSLFLGSLPPVTQVEEVDELGRVIPQPNSPAAKRDRRIQRLSRRARRNARLQSTPTDEEGYSTDSSLSPADAADYETAKQRLRSDGEAIFSDVKSEEFNDPRLGLGKWFEEWRSRYSDIYIRAWGGPGMVAAWEFWARMEMLGWNPFEDSNGLDSFLWSASLHEYSQSSLDDESDPQLVPEMISTAIAPRLCKLIESGALDPYSAQDVRRVVDLAEQVEASLNEGHVRFQALLKAVYLVFNGAITEVIEFSKPYFALNTPPFDPEAIPARRRFISRRIKLLKNLMRWRKYTGERFGIGELVTNFVDRCILPTAETGWEVGGQDIMQKAVALLPSELVSVRVNSRLALT